MQEYLGYILAGLVFIMAVVLIIAITKIVGMEREIRESRRETAQTLAQSYASINQALADDELATEQRLEYLRNTMENRLIAIQGDNNRQLERMRQVVDEKLQTSLDEKLTRSFDSVRQSLQEVYKGIGEMQNLAAGVGDLKKVL
ncbi:MAG: DNA recombination protein RmuC, partial [Firmicutes bacterium]|nr:DNA recombination protein RmuC [Bacillota bacterium]